MKLHEKIKQTRKSKGLSMVVLEDRLKKIFGEKALRYNTLYRIERGLREARASSLLQICAGLDITLQELQKDTEKETLYGVNLITKRNKIAQYMYSEKAYTQILTQEKQPFMGMRLMLEPGGKTSYEQDPAELGKFEKWVYGLKGKITCSIGKDKYYLKKDEALCFESTVPHYFENETPKKASCIIIQNPKHL